MKKTVKNRSYVNNDNLYTYGRNPRNYSGLICESDFVTSGRPDSNRSVFADRVTSAWKFDNDCDKLQKQEERRREWEKENA